MSIDTFSAGMAVTEEDERRERKNAPNRLAERSEFGQWIESRRQELDQPRGSLTQEALAQRSGFSKPHLVRVMRGDAELSWISFEQLLFTLRVAARTEFRRLYEMYRRSLAPAFRDKRERWRIAESGHVVPIKPDGTVDEMLLSSASHIERTHDQAVTSGSYVRETAMQPMYDALHLDFTTSTGEQRARVLLESLLLEFAESGASNELLRWARRVLNNPANYIDETEAVTSDESDEHADEQKLRDMEGLAAGIRAILQSRRESANEDTTKVARGPIAKGFQTKEQRQTKKRRPGDKSA